MTKVLLSFRINFEQLDDDGQGVIFHRRLLDGKNNSIKLNVALQNANAKVWFERCGYTDDLFIRYDRDVRKIDPQIMARQGCLFSGPLFGLIEIEKFPKKILDAIKDSNKGNEDYINFAKDLAQKILYQPISNFIETLQTNYGQYWLKNIPKWDSRFCSLGYYCSHTLNLRWSLDEGKTWGVFDPDKPDTVKATFVAKPMPDYLQYMNEDDWNNLSALSGNRSSSDNFLIRCHQLCEEGDLRLAFIEAATALELSINHFLRERSTSDFRTASFESFYNLPLRTQLSIISSIINGIAPEQIDKSIEAVDIRNKIVHEGYEPPFKAATELYCLLRTISTVLGGGVTKFPSHRFPTTSVPEEKWKNYYIK